MDFANLEPQQVSSLVERILQEKDPASVGLRRIVRRKVAEGRDFPLREFAAEEFVESGAGRKALTEDEERLIELERRVASLQKEMERQNERARQAIQKAYAQGYDEGRKKGAQEEGAAAAPVYQKKVAALQEHIGTYLKNFEEEKYAIYAKADRILLELCCRMVKKILGTEPVLQPEVVLSVLRKALSFVAEREKLVVRVSPRDRDIVAGNKDFWAPVTERLKDITIEADERIEPGGCIIESNAGVTDARLGVQLHELTEVIEKAWEALHATKNTAGADDV